MMAPKEIAQAINVLMNPQENLWFRVLMYDELLAEAAERDGTELGEMLLELLLIAEQRRLNGRRPLKTVGAEHGYE